MGVIAAPTYRSAGILPGYKGALGLADSISAGAFIMIGRNNKRFIDEFQPARSRHPEQGQRRPRRHA